MALAGTGNALGDAILLAIEALDQTADGRSRTIMWRTIGTVIVNHIIANATVNVTSVSGVSSGGGTSGPGTGTVG